VNILASAVTAQPHLRPKEMTPSLSAEKEEGTAMHSIHDPMRKLGEKVKICHLPEGIGDDFQTITVSVQATASHLDHGDIMHACSEVCEDLCDDADFCTVDYQGDCELSGCLPTPRQIVDCDNGIYCDGVETCDSSIGCQSTPITCTAPLFCDEAANACVECTDNINCSDGLYCNGAEICGLDHTCQTGTAISCPVATPLCDEASDACVECITDSDCDNGQKCDGVETCNVNHACQSGSAICCGGTTPFCDEAAEACVECTADADCDNGLYCDGIETCDELDHICQPGTAISCLAPEFCNEANDQCELCTLFAGLPEPTGYEPVYKLNIPDQPNFVNLGVQYAYDHSATIGAFNRIAYYLELESTTYGS
jgi:Cys-rich repeat protein